MESDLKRIARLEYLKLRQCKQTEKTEAVKVRFWTIENVKWKLSRHVNFEDPFWSLSCHESYSLPSKSTVDYSPSVTYSEKKVLSNQPKR